MSKRANNAHWGEEADSQTLSESARSTALFDEGEDPESPHPGSRVSAIRGYFSTRWAIFALPARRAPR